LVRTRDWSRATTVMVALAPFTVLGAGAWRAGVWGAETGGGEAGGGPACMSSPPSIAEQP